MLPMGLNVKYCIVLGVGIELFLVPASAPRLVYQKPWHVLSCLWEMRHITEALLLIRKRVAHVVTAAGFLSVSGPLPTRYNSR